LLTCVLLLVLAAAAAPASPAPEDARRQMLEILRILEGDPPYTAPGGAQPLADLRKQVLAMTPEQVAVLADPTISAKIGDALASLRASASVRTRVKARAATGVAPGPKPGPGAAAAAAAIPAFPALEDLPYSPLCGGPDPPFSTDAAFGLLTGSQAAEEAAVIAQGICDSVVVGFGFGGSPPGSCAAAAVLQAVAVGARAAYDHAELCDGDINGVITRGTYEGLAVVHSKIDGTFRRESRIDCSTA
jgi:hypothetical protein